MSQKWRKDFQVWSKAWKKLANSLATLLAILLQGKKGSPPGIMTLHTPAGGRKYLNAEERHRFAAAAQIMPAEVRAFCLLLMWSGCRISEALAVTPLAVDQETGTIALRTLKRRKSVIIRQVPLPMEVLADLAEVFNLSNRERHADGAEALLWNWSRVTGWRHVKNVMERAGISGAAATAKGLRHAFGVAAFESVPPHIVQRWLGHASLRTTAIYGNVSGEEERIFAQRVWDRW
jgi:integrase/recombinase XerD